jgi:hypothetical protein
MNEVIPAGCRQGGVERCRPLFISSGEAPHLIWRKAEIAERLPKWHALADRIEELLTYVDW